MSLLAYLLSSRRRSSTLPADSQFGKAIWTCKSQLQVNDGFSVHESVSFKDTISFLRMRTDIFKERYEVSRLLTPCPSPSSMRAAYSPFISLP